MTLDGMCDAFHHGPPRAISLGNGQQLEFVLAGPPFSFQLVMFFIIFFCLIICKDSNVKCGNTFH